MNLLLDTQLLIWSVREPERLSAVARDILTDQTNALFFSAASIWEVGIKHARGRSDFDFDPRPLRANLLAEGYEEIPITGEHGIAASGLPPLHKDPFDRLIRAQATVEGLTLLTSDRTLARYPGPVQRV